MVPITIVNGVYKPSYNWGAPHCMNHMIPMDSARNNCQDTPKRVKQSLESLVGPSALRRWFSRWFQARPSQKINKHSQCGSMWIIMPNMCQKTANRYVKFGLWQSVPVFFIILWQFHIAGKIQIDLDRSGVKFHGWFSAPSNTLDTARCRNPPSDNRNLVGLIA